MKKKRYKENVFCKVFYETFNMMDIIKELPYEKVDTASKRHVTFKFKSSPPKKMDVVKELVEAVSKIIEDNLQVILDRINREDPNIEKVDMTAKLLVSKLFDVSKSEYGNLTLISINMER